ncbi:MAG: hypothetical protein VB061_02865 [Christensenella sp.]|nr:hypothetical protein [Christensenella sp.]
MKKQTILFIALMSTLLLLGAGCATQAKAPEAAAAPADSSLIWQISVETSEITSSISSTEAMVTYGGDVSQVSHSDDSSEGNVYLLVLANIDKNQPGKEKFVWSELSVLDADGNAYARMDNDTFLETHGLPRIKSTDLSIGNNHGYVCFEVPASSDFSKLTLVYAAEGSAQNIALSPSVGK